MLGSIKVLKAYRKEWDEEHGCWKDKPRHDWASHGADAFRTLACAYRDVAPPLTPEQEAEKAEKKTTLGRRRPNRQ